MSRYFLLFFSIYFLTCSIDANSLSRFEVQKSDHLAKAIQADFELREELEKVTSYVHAHWNDWMAPRRCREVESYRKKKISDLTTVTIHPCQKEVCLYIDGHTKRIGSGSYKRVYRGLSYTKEEEIAVAIPYQTCWSDEALSESSDDGSSTSSQISSSENPEWVRDALHEAKMLEVVRGAPGILQVYSVAFPKKKRNSLPVIIGKYYSGGDFYHALDRYSPTLEEAVTIAEDLLLGLSEMHSRYTVHRDLHGGNVLIDVDKKTDTIRGAVISDFGLAKCYDSIEDPNFQWAEKMDCANLYTLLTQLFENVLHDNSTFYLSLFDLAEENQLSAKTTLDKLNEI